MLKILIKKEFRECFRSYFVNQKTGKIRSKGKTVSMIAGFGLLMLILCAMFLGLATTLRELIDAPGLKWLYYAVMGLFALAMGIFGSVFNTYSALYLAKDNDLLLSMPIPPSTILISRLSLVFGLGLMYSAVVWIPGFLYAWRVGMPTSAEIAFGIVLTIFIGLLVTVVATVLGWVIAVISTKMKNRSIIVVLLSLIFFGAYYYASTKLTNLIAAIVSHGEAVGAGLRKWGNLIYQLGRAASGNVGAMVIFCLSTLALMALCLVILSRSFIRIVTRAPSAAKKTVKAKGVPSEERNHSVKSALFHKELKRFTSSPTYMLNCGMGAVILILCSVLAVVKRENIMTSISAITAEAPMMASVIPLGAVFAVCAIISISSVSTPSVSLEGKNLWILKSLPVSPGDVLSAKERLNRVINAVPGVLAAVILSLCVGADLLTAVMAGVLVYSFVRLTGTFGLIVGLKHPNFTWTSENKPIKQSSNLLVTMLLSLLVAIGCCGLYLPLGKNLDLSNYFIAVFLVLTMASRYLDRWLATKGAAIFESL